MRVRFDPEKDRTTKRRHGVSLRQAEQIFDQAYVVDQKNDDPLQFRAIGWAGDRLCSVIFEIRSDAEGHYIWLITAWKATIKEHDSYAENV